MYAHRRDTLVFGGKHLRKWFLSQKQHWNFVEEECVVVEGAPAEYAFLV